MHFQHLYNYDVSFWWQYEEIDILTNDDNLSTNILCIAIICYLFNYHMALYNYDLQKLIL